MADPPQHLAATPESADEDPPLAAVMTTKLVAITPDASLATALRLMASTNVRHLPVVQGRRCLGLVTEADLVRCLASEPGPLPAASRTPVWQLTRPAQPIPASARRSDAARKMYADGTDAVLVDDGTHLLGIVTASDLIRSLAATGPAGRGIRHDSGRPS